MSSDMTQPDNYRQFTAEGRRKGSTLEIVVDWRIIRQKYWSSKVSWNKMSLQEQTYAGGALWWFRQGQVYKAWGPWHFPVLTKTLNNISNFWRKSPRFHGRKKRVSTKKHSLWGTGPLALFKIVKIQPWVWRSEISYLLDSFLNNYFSLTNCISAKMQFQGVMA